MAKSSPRPRGWPMSLLSPTATSIAVCRARPRCSTLRRIDDQPGMGRSPGRSVRLLRRQDRSGKGRHSVNAAARGSKAGSVNARGASLRIAALSKRYEGARTIAVDDLSLDVAAGEFVSLLGASGSGKTTTLMAVAGFTPPDKRGIGVVFQNYALFPHMSALRNVMFPLRMRGVASGEAKHRAERSLERVGLGPLGHRLPAQLSGGQQQRVALARAIVFEPGLMLMDEPLGALDRALREKMKAEIRRLHRELGITILYVTHDQEEALALSDRIALMQQGRIAQIGTPAELYERPNSA